LSVKNPDGRQIVLTKVADLSSAVFGEMCLVQIQGLQAFLELQAQKQQLSNLTLAEIYSLSERSAPKGSQFVRGMGYFLAINDHIFFLKTQLMTSELLHGYFEWLFGAPTPLLPTGASFKLQAEFDKSQLAGDIGDIKKLRVSGSSGAEMAVSAVDDGDGGPRRVSTKRKVADRSYTFERALKVADAMFGESKTEELVKSLGPDEYLSVDASVSVRGTRTEESRKKLKQIANELADLTEGKVQIEGKDGKLSDDDAILRTRMPFDLPHDGSNLLEFDNVADQLREVYSRFVRDGKIPT
jgi:hypothetical protein